jgi:hypothetical protein
LHPANALNFNITDMKTLILFSLLFAAIAASSQTVPLAMRFDTKTWIRLEEKSYLAGGKVGTLTIKIRGYDVYRTASGQFYIEYQDPKLVYRRKYLGYAFGTHEYEGSTVFFNADTTKAWMWMPDRYSAPTMKMDLPDYFAEWARAKKDEQQNKTP